MRRLFTRETLGLEPAVLVAFAARAWQSLAGLATLFFIIRYLAPETQGYHQTFLSLLSLQTFVELGILITIVSVVSHEWAGLSLQPDRRARGDPAKLNRLSATARFVAVWFSGAALLLLIFAGSTGAIILGQHGKPEVWALPWGVTIVLGAIFLWCQGLIAVIEGSNQVLPVASFRFLQSFLSTVAFWLALMAGAGLWALPIQLGTNVLCGLVFVFGIYRPFISQLLRNRGPSDFKWKVDVWPMQWPLALQGLGSFFWFALFVPVLFSYHGPVVAGQMGLSLQMVIAMMALASSWLSVKAPQLGTMFAAGDYRGYTSAWRKAAIMSSLVLVVGAAALALLLLVAWGSGLPEASRVLPPGPFALLVLWAIVLHVIGCMATYWRAQRVELLRFRGILPGMATGLGVWWLGKEFGAVGATSGALFANLLVGLPLCFLAFLEAHRRTAERAGEQLSQIAPSSASHGVSA